MDDDDNGIEDSPSWDTYEQRWLIECESCGGADWTSPCADCAAEQRDAGSVSVESDDE